MSKIVEYVLMTSHAVVGNIMDKECSIIIEFKAGANSYPFTTYMLNENRPGIRKHMSNHSNLPDAMRASDELVAERRRAFVLQFDIKLDGPFTVWYQYGPEEGSPALIHCAVDTLEEARTVRNGMLVSHKDRKVWISDNNDEIVE